MRELPGENHQVTLTQHPVAVTGHGQPTTALGRHVETGVAQGVLLNNPVTANAGIVIDGNTPAKQANKIVKCSQNVR